MIKKKILNKKIVIKKNNTMYLEGEFMKNKNIIIGLIIGIAMAILWSVIFVGVLNSFAGIGVGICLGIAFGISSSLIFYKQDKNKE